MATTDSLQSLGAYEFEHYVAELWEAQGWGTEVSQQSADAGIDIVARRYEPVAETHVIQAKRYQEANKVGGPEIQQYASLRQQVPEADAVVVVTTSSFTKAARQRARELNVKLINGKQLSDLASEYMDGSDAPRQRDLDTGAQEDRLEDSVALGALGILAVAIEYAANNIADLLYIGVVFYVMLKIVDVLMFNIPLV